MTLSVNPSCLFACGPTMASDMPLCSSHESKAPSACFQFFLELLGCKDLVIRQSFLLYKTMLFRM